MQAGSLTSPLEGHTCGMRVSAARLKHSCAELCSVTYDVCYVCGLLCIQLFLCLEYGSRRLLHDQLLCT